ncbi:MAG: hypothetical protein CBD47_03535 [Synechococcus sp. TMED187]|nr:MAG: hypothetical protein CBD47_03535 [Synechococcus sp. TMED187]
MIAGAESRRLNSDDQWFQAQKDNEHDNGWADSGARVKVWKRTMEVTMTADTPPEHRPDAR